LLDLQVRIAIVAKELIFVISGVEAAGDAGDAAIYPSNYFRQI